MFRVGCHISIAGKIFKSVDRAKTLGCTAMQIFSHNPRGWKLSPLSDDDVRIFRERLDESGICPLVVHTSYLINLASPDDDLYRKSIDSFKVELERAYTLGASFLVTHLGSFKDRDLEFGIKRVTEALNQALESARQGDVRILLENTTGSGSTIGSDLCQLRNIINAVKENNSLGLCFDTCHGFASGYDIRDIQSLDSVIKKIDRLLGLERLCLIHLNDSKGELGSRLDRHEHIGKGKIGLKGFEIIINHPSLREIPMILETPKNSDEDDINNISIVKGMRRCVSP